MSARVRLIYVGGTLGMHPADAADPASPLVPGGLDALEAALRAELPAHLDGADVDLTFAALTDDAGVAQPPLDSSDVGPDHWRWIAHAVRDAHDAGDGAVVLHGTDTLAYTSSALSFVLDGLTKPVVVTGARRPVSASGTDAVTNVADAIRVVLASNAGPVALPEVVVGFGGTVLRGNRARKVSTTSDRSFASPNLAPLAYVGEAVDLAAELVRPVPAQSEAPAQAHAQAHAPVGCTVRPALDRGVVDVTLVPGMSARRLAAVLLHDDVTGAVLRTFGSGNAPSDPALLDVIGEATAAGVVVVAVTQCVEGGVDAGRYATGQHLVDRGVVTGLDMTPEAAFTKLMWLLANEPAAHVGALVSTDLRGELTTPALGGTATH